MIDVDRIESQLEPAFRRRRRVAVAPSRPTAPAIGPAFAATSARVLARLRASVATPAAAADPTGSPVIWTRRQSRLVELVELGHLEEAERLVADLGSPREKLSWSTMRALFAGDEVTARSENRAMHRLAQDDRDQEAMDRYWLQRFWLVAAWGNDAERDELAEYGRERAYRTDDLQWTAALAALLAQMGKAGEAGEAFEDAFGRLGRADDAVQLDVATNLVEAAAALGDAFLGARLHYTLTWAPGRLVTVGQGWICKGAIERFRALGEASVGMFAEADEDFRRAADCHRGLGAQPLLARTLHQWGTTLVGRDGERAAACFREADALVADLELTDPSLSRRRRP